MLPESAFTSDALTERSVKINGAEVILHFRELPAADWIKFHATVSTGSEEARAAAACKLIAASLRNPDGTPAMSEEKALTLKTGPLNALFEAVRAVNEGDAGND